MTGKTEEIASKFIEKLQSINRTPKSEHWIEIETAKRLTEESIVTGAKTFTYADIRRVRDEIMGFTDTPK